MCGGDPLTKLTDSQRKAFEKAMVEFRESQELSLDHAGGHLVLASFDRQHGRIEEAIQHLVDAIKLEPYLAGPRAELASLMQEHSGDPARDQAACGRRRPIWSSVIRNSRQITRTFSIGLVCCDTRWATMTRPMRRFERPVKRRRGITTTSWRWRCCKRSGTPRRETTTQFNAAIASLKTMHELIATRTSGRSKLWNDCWQTRSVKDAAGCRTE